MARPKKATNKPAAKQAAKPAKSGPVVTNKSTTALVINGVKLKRGESATIKDFDPETAKHKAWLSAGMLAVK